jgi:hypothetical protein
VDDIDRSNRTGKSECGHLRKRKFMERRGKRRRNGLPAYVEIRDKGYWVAKTRVSLDSVVRAFLDGVSPETLVVEHFLS